MRDLTSARFVIGGARQTRQPIIGEPWAAGGVPEAPPRRDTLFGDLAKLVRALIPHRF